LASTRSVTVIESTLVMPPSLLLFLNCRGVPGGDHEPSRNRTPWIGAFGVLVSGAYTLGTRTPVRPLTISMWSGLDSSRW
jgi:hypothetical protein